LTGLGTREKNFFPKLQQLVIEMFWPSISFSSLRRNVSADWPRCQPACREILNTYLCSYTYMFLHVHTPMNLRWW
jgi:hypothetical protein